MSWNDETYGKYQRPHDRTLNKFGRGGPWIEIEPWAAFLEAVIGKQGGFGEVSREEFSERLGIPPRRLWGWLRREFDYVRLDIVENALWLYDCLYVEDVLPDVIVFETHPGKRLETWREAEWLRAELEAEGYNERA